MADDAVPNIIVLGFFSTFETLPVKNEFDEYVMVDNPRKKGEEIRQMAVQEVDWVTYAPVSSVLSMRNSERVKHLDPAELERHNSTRQGAGDDTGQRLAFFKYRWAQIKPAYDAWKKGIELPLNGTPLQSWALMRPEIIAQFTPFGIRTVEDVATMTEAVAQRVKLPNVRSYSVMAQKYLADADKSDAIAREQARDDEVAQLKADLAEAMKLLRARPTAADDEQAERAAPRRAAAAAPKGKPGRPTAKAAGKPAADTAAIEQALAQQGQPETTV